MCTQEAGLTELIWEGKYDKDNRKIAPLRVRLPFQTVETVNESAQQRQHTLDLFSSGRPAEWRNRLIWGDKKYVLPALLEEFAGQVNLIYIDPPFDTGADFSFQGTARSSRKNHLSSSRRRIEILGARAWIHTCNGFTKQQYCCTSYCETQEVSTCIWTRTFAITPKL